MHEHIFQRMRRSNRTIRTDRHPLSNLIADAVNKLRAAKRSGIDSLVDLTVVGLGRNVERIARIAEQVDLNIIVATGVYMATCRFNCTTGSDSLIGGPDPMIGMFDRDIKQGIANTGVKAAILKCASDAPGLQPGVLILRAVAHVHRVTGVLIATHSNAAIRGV